MRGHFISFEGIDGSGKTTQLHAAARHLAEQGRSVTVTREPGGTPIAEQIRQILLRKENHGMNPLCELLLLAAARAQHVHDVIRPTINAGRVLLCDRYSDATWAYQHGGRGLSAQHIDALCAMAEQEVTPGLTFLFDLPCAEALRRVELRHAKPGVEPASRFDEEALAFHERVRASYLKRADEFPDRIVVVPASGDVKSVTQVVIRHLDDLLGIAEEQQHL